MCVGPSQSPTAGREHEIALQCPGELRVSASALHSSMENTFHPSTPVGVFPSSRSTNRAICAQRVKHTVVKYLS